MELYEMILLVAGSLCVVISFVLSYWYDASLNHRELDGKKEQTWQQEEVLQTAQKEIVMQLEEEVLSTLKEKMNEMTNEKMIAIHEYSEGILERLQTNQNETVFLYKMLCDKEEAIKKQMNSQTNVGNEEKESTNETEPEELNYETFLAEYHSNKEKILALHQKNRSVVDISKQLNIGQGEVTLVLNLYGRKE